MATWIQDFKFGARMLGRNPGFSAMAMVVLAVGIGANSAMFSIVNDFVLKPTLVREPARITGIYGRDRQKPDTWHGFSYPAYVDIRQQNKVFSEVMAHNVALVGVADENDSTRRVFSDVISSNYFAMLGAPLYAGRTFTAEEERPGSDIAVTIVSYGFWKKSGWPDWNGRPLKVNGRNFTVVGVAKDGFTGTTALVSPALYLPLGVYSMVANDFSDASRSIDSRTAKELMLAGRLRPGITAQVAQAQLAGVAANLGRAYPATDKDVTFTTAPLARATLSTRPMGNGPLYFASTLLLGMAVLVLLVAAFNVANMTAARGAARRKEIAVRLALGAGRGAILRQLFAEGLLLAALGGTGGLFLAYAATGAMVRSLGGMLPLDVVFSATPDVRVIAATAGFCLLSTIVFALGPARDAARQDVTSTLKGAEGASERGHWGRLFSRRNLLVMSQLSLSLMLLSAAGLFVRSAMAQAELNPGFRVAGQILAEVDGGLAGYDEARGRALYPKLVERLRTIPGVSSVSLAATVPFGMVSLGKNVWRADQPITAKAARSQYNIVSPGYFQTMDIPLLRGRAFTESDAPGRTRVAIVDQKLARALWPSGNPIGKTIRLEDSHAGTPKEAEVVGIVGPIRDELMGDTDFQPHAWASFGQEYQSDVTFHLQTAKGADADSVLREARRRIREEDERLPILNLRTLQSHMEASLDFWIVRMAARIFAVFGLVALLVASIGLYGVRAYTVARRTREIGIRMAIGANARDAVRLILREGVRVSLVAAAVGLGLSLLAGRLLAGTLFGVSAADPVVFGGAAAMLVAISLAACWLPARRAARVQPMTALRTE
jgi:predicted permease